MQCKVNLKTDPISLIVIAADGNEHMLLDACGDGSTIQVVLESKTPFHVLTLQRFESMAHGEIIARGLTIDDCDRGIGVANTGHQIRWLAVKGGGNDWAIYYGLSYLDEDNIRRTGDKLYNKDNIRKCVPCEDELFKLYRY